MTDRRLMLAAASLCVAFGCRAQPLQATPVAFIHVNVIPMDRERVLKDTTVVVRDGRIATLGAVPVPADAKVIDGRGEAYLSPGLADMHTHSDTLDEMEVYLANGVTSVLNMGGASNGFMAQTRVRLNNGTRPGPHVYAAMMVDGSAQYGHLMVTTPAEARAVVLIAKANGFQFIKVYDDLSPECYGALVEAARRLKLGVVGHSVAKVGLRAQIEAGQSMIAHTEEFIYTYFLSDPDAPPSRVPALSDIPSAIGFIKQHGTFVTADLNTYATIARQWGRPDLKRELMAVAQRRYLAPRWRMEWADEDYANRQGSLAGRLEFLTRFTKALADADVSLIAGTDAPAVAGLVPGFSLHDDLDALVGAGLTRYQALSAATRVPGAFIHQQDPKASFGTVTQGSRADLMLSKTNPLEDLSTLRAPLGVMASGHWYSQDELQALLKQVASRFDSAECGLSADQH